MKNHFTITLTLLICWCASEAGEGIVVPPTLPIAQSRTLETAALPSIGPDTPLPRAQAAFSQARWEYDYDSWVMGFTWYDYQHNASQCKQIAVSDNGTVHVAWTRGDDYGATTRHVVYGCWQDGDVYGPVLADNEARSGYCTLDVLDGDALYPNAVVVAFHQGGGMTIGTALSPDWGSCWLSLLPVNHPSGEDPPICPHLAIDIDNKVHFIATRMFDQVSCYDATVDFDTWETPDWIDLPTLNFGISAMPVTSEFDNRVAWLSHNYIPVHPDDEGLIFSQTINDLWVHIAEDGDFTNWEAVSSINLTDLLDAETTQHPLPGHVYAYCDMDGVFDSDGNLHVVYTTRPYWADYTLVDGVGDEEEGFERWSEAGQIWHAMIAATDEAITFSHVAGYVGTNNDSDPALASYFEGDPGGWGSLSDRPSLAIDPADNTLYCMWRNFTNLPDTSVLGLSNADLWIRASCDLGISWGEALNITNSCTPDCEAGNCASEAWGTLAEIVYDDYLHLEFVEDLDAGAVTQEEGDWTENPVWYLRVPVADVPCTDPWDQGPLTTRLTDTFWEWGGYSDGDYEITDFMHLLNEGRETVQLQSIEILYHQEIPNVVIEQLNGNLGEAISSYQSAVYQYVWNAVIGDDQHDAVIRFHTSGGSVDFRLSNRNPLDLETAQSFIWWESVAPAPAPPARFTLARNYPNPFNPATTIEFTLASPLTIRLEVFNLLGERVALLAEGMHAAGAHRITFDAGELPSGTYLYRLSSDNFAVSRKLLLLR